MPIPLLMRLLPYIVAVVAVLGIVYGIHHHGYNAGVNEIQTKWDAAEHAAEQAQAAKNMADAERIRKLEVVKNENIVEIDRLRANNRALFLRIPQTACIGSQASADNTAGAGQLPDKAQAAFDRFMAGVADEAYRADRVVEDCRVLNEYLKN